MYVLCMLFNAKNVDKYWILATFYVGMYAFLIFCKKYLDLRCFFSTFVGVFERD